MSYLALAKKIEAGLHGEEKQAEPIGVKASNYQFSKSTSGDVFSALGIAVLLHSEQYGDVWLIPNECARGQIGLAAVTILPEELEILQVMDPAQIKRVFLVKRQIPGTKVCNFKEYQ